MCLVFWMLKFCGLSDTEIHQREMKQSSSQDSLYQLSYYLL